MRCEKCGDQMDVTAAFCENCGAPIPCIAPTKYTAPAQACPPSGSYTPSDYQPMKRDIQKDEMSMGAWLVSLLITVIPFVGLVMAFVWAFGGSAPLSKRNFYRAALILGAAYVVLVFVLSFVLVIFNYKYF